MTATYEQQPHAHYSPQPRNGFGITALVLALIGAVFALVPLTGFIALILGGLAVLFGLMGLARTRTGVATNKKMSTISAGIGALVAAAGIWGITLVFGAVDQLDKDLHGLGGDFEPARVSAPAAPGVVGTSALHDVTVSRCTTDTSYGMTEAQANVAITNSTDRARSYWATIAVDDMAGNRLGEINAVANELQPGQTAKLAGMDAATMINGSVNEIRCTVVSVDRF